jgi:ornithine carbamoyltransferase
MRHLITLDDISPPEINRVFELSAELKLKFGQGIRESLLPGRILALLFEKQSLRTRVSFEAGIAHLGGNSLLLGQDVGFGSRESIEDFARVLGSMVDVIVARAKTHATVEALANHADCHVINGLTDLAHPCQALADLYTIRERFGELRGKTLTWIGDGNNVATSLARACNCLGMKFVCCTPEGYELDSEVVADFTQRFPNFELTQSQHPQDAVREAAAVYTDVWASMGQEGERAQRKADFAKYQVNPKLMASAPDNAIFMHCLPARRGEEVTDDVIDGPQSVVLQQANNRLHVQKGILAWLLRESHDEPPQP